MMAAPLSTLAGRKQQSSSPIKSRSTSRHQADEPDDAHARSQLIAGQDSATSIAYGVGYESQNQLRREDAGLFGRMLRCLRIMWMSSMQASMTLTAGSDLKPSMDGQVRAGRSLECLQIRDEVLSLFWLRYPNRHRCAAHQLRRSFQIGIQTGVVPDNV